MPTNRDETKFNRPLTTPAERAKRSKAARVNASVESAVAKYNASVEGRVAEKAAINTAERDATLRALAGLLGFETLETRNSDSADFKEVSVWGLKAALEAAYAAGKASK